MAESDTWAFPVAYFRNENEKILLEDDHDDTSVKISDISSLTFDDIVNHDKIIINDNLGRSVEQDNANAIENTGVLLEDFGQLLLNGTDSTSTNANSFLIQETDKRNRFTLELSGSLIEEKFSSNSVIERILLENEHNSLLSLESQEDDTDDSGIKLEIQGVSGDDVIILNATGFDDPLPNAGDKVLLEESLRTNTSSELLLESTNIITSEGQIPIENWTLNSSVNPVGAQPVVQASEIVVRTTGDIALEDETVNNVDGVTSHGHLVLNGTDSTSSNAGDNFDLEGATGITI
jgi:hypothetical protein